MLDKLVVYFLRNKNTQTAMKKKMIENEEPAVNSENDEMVILCSPVRASNTAPPVETWLTNNKCIFR